MLLLTSCPWVFGCPQDSATLSTAEALPASHSEGASVGREGFLGNHACQNCHRDKFATYIQTAHHRTSRLPDKNTIAGHFTPGHNIMNTFNPELFFRMDVRNNRFYQTAILEKLGHTTRHSEPFDLVVGSDTKGQTYAYWKGDLLYELPVSYWTELNEWVNSPGYVDGSADFDRPITPRCVECHGTYIQALDTSLTSNRYNKSNFVLGISCERCHGAGGEHVKSHAATASDSRNGKPMQPLGSTRERQIDVCAQCHGGVGEEVAPPFSFKPGDPLSNYIKLKQPDPNDRVDVHGNQVTLLERSLCFRSSPNMTCTTCHDVHSSERPAASYSDRCLECHQPEKCGMFAKLGRQIAANCVDCHMPVQASSMLVVDANDKRVSANVRTHWIKVYPEVQQR
jgi:Cytochrome c554 and c-prime